MSFRDLTLLLIKLAGTDLQIVAFSTLGIYLLFQILSDFSFHISYLYFSESIENGGTPFLIDTYAYIFSTLMELIFALYLLFGANSITKLIASIREIGYK